MIRIALAQLNPTVGDLSGNRRKVEEAIQQAQAWRADVVAVPELALTGYPPEDLLLKPAFVEANLRALQQLVPASRGLVAVVGFVNRDRTGKLYNAAALLANGQWRATYHKQCLPNYGVFDEKRYFASGTQPLLAQVAGVRMGVTICEDLWETWPSQVLAQGGCQLVLNISASPYHAGKLPVRQRLFAARARANRLAIAYCNLVGGQDELVFDGASLILDAHGTLLARGAQFREDFVVYDVERSHLGRAASHRGDGLKVSLAPPRRPALHPALKPTLGPVEEVYEALVLGVRDYVKKNGFSTVVLGLSGGIDSALTVCLAVDALGAACVKGLVMPSRYSSRATQADAKQLGANLGIEVREISIEPVFRAYLKTLEPFFKGRQADITEQNLQARIRGNLLMALSNKFGWLVLTTGNKSEIATGYTTLYGDMAGGFAVIKDVPKTLVYQVAQFRQHRGLAAPIPPHIMTRVPTAELAPHQTDQDTLPAYDVLDRILKSYVEDNRSIQEILAMNRVDASTVRQVARMVDRAEYKRRQGPPGIKITPRAFGRDRRMPITNHYHQD